MASRFRIWCLFAIAAASLTAPTALAQAPGTGLAPVPGASTVPGFGSAPSAGSALGAPAFDSYATGAAPSLTTPPPSNLFSSPTTGAAPNTAPWNAMPPSSGSPYGATPASPWGATAPPAASPYGAGAPYGAASPYGGYGGQPPPASLFPNGVFPQSPNGSTPPLRVFENLRIRETWIYGDSGNDLGINDIETAVTMMLPNFLGGNTPLMVSPNFALHLWDGPQPPGYTQFLPGNAYSAYLEFAYNTDHAQAIGADLAASVGVFTDFDTLVDDSVRIQTLSYGWARLTPNMMLKLGVNYLDRVDIKLLPAFGLLWEPNPQTRLDIFFPRPKLSHLWTTMGTTDVWWYIGAEYGGGSWTIKYAPSGTTDQVDINDIRVVLGIDWVNQSGMRGMFEVGWVTSRDLVYRYHPSENIGLNDSFMLRGGLAF